MLQANVEKDMSPPKRHHYVPNMILRNFTNDGGQLHCWRRAGTKNKIWKAPPENAFVVGHLYTKRDEFGNPDMSIEKDLSVVEGNAAAVIDKVINCSLNGNCPRLSPSERERLGRFIDHQHRRTPEIHALIDNDLENWEADLLASFEREYGRLPTEEERAEIEDPELRRRMKQKMIADLAGLPPEDDVLKLYAERPIEFRVIRNERKSFVIGSRSEPGKWFPVHKQVVFRLVAEDGPDSLTEIHDMAVVRRINKETVRDSLAFAGPSEQLVQSLAGSA